MTSRSMKLVLLLLLLGVAIQFFPVDRSNPPVQEDIAAPPQVKAILKRACYDCHSNETIWPWYSHVAPVSWLLAWDVHEGREELNFSTWNRYSPKKRNKLIKEIWEEIQEGEMPPWFYLPLHPEADLSDQDHRALQEWAGSGSKFNEEDDG
jgi:cytochrome c551/c552